MKKILLSIACLLGSLLTTAQTGAALSFSGGGDFVQLADPNYGTSNFTLETWMKPNATNGAYLISTRTNEFGGAGNWFVLSYNSGKIGLELSDEGFGSGYFETAGTPVTFGAWNHVALVRSGLQFSIYVNGILSASYTDTGLRNFITGTNSIRLSGWANVGVAFFNGMMDETRFWNVARTACQINTFMNCEIPTTATGLIGNYHFNQGVAAGTNSGITSLTDVSGSSRTGTLNNFALTGAVSNWITPGGVVSGFTTTLAPPVMTVSSGVVAIGSSYTMTPGGGVSYTYTPSGPVVSPTVMTSYTVTGTAVTGCTNTAVSTVSIQGAALHFDGANDFVDCGNIMPSTYSKEAWIYITNLGLQNNVISGGGDGQHALYPSVDFGNRLSAGHNGTWTFVQDPTPMVANTWYHVALTYDAATTTMKLYKNGTLVSTNTSVPPFIGGNALRIGSFDPLQNLFGGKMDEVRIWNRVLCQSEIQNNKNAELPSGQVGLVAYYKMNQGVASAANATVTSLTDASGNANNGTLSNFALTGTTSNWVVPGAVVTGSLSPAFASPTVSIAGINTICNGASATFTASGANTYAWFSGQTTSIIAVTPSVTTSYTVVGKNAAGCTSGMVVKTLTVNATPTISVNSGSIIAGSSFTFIPTGGVSYTYNPAGPIVTPTTSTTYTITGDNALGCTKTAIVTISVQASSLNFDGSNDYVQIADNANLDFGSGDFTVEYWVNKKANSSSFSNTGGVNKWNTGLSAGTNEWLVGLTETGSDNLPSFWIESGATIYKCPATTSLILNAWYHIAAVRQGTDIKIFVNGKLENTVAVGNISINNVSRDLLIGKINAGFNASMSIDELRIWNLARTQCEINTYKDCEIPTTASGLIINSHFNQGYANRVNSTITTLSNVSGTANTGSLIGFALTGLGSNWIVPSVVASGYTTTANVTPTVTSVVTNSVICFGNSTTLTGTGANTYTWTAGVSNAIAFTPTTTSSYTVTGTSTLTGCSSSAVNSVTVNALPTVSVNSGAICAGQSFTMVPTGAVTYTYSNGTNIVTPIADATYSVSGTDANGCVSSTVAVSSVTVNALPIISVNSGAICAGQSFTMVPTGAVTYTYSNGTDIVTPTADATYSVSGIDANGCVSSTVAVSSVTVNALPTISVNSGAICAGQSFTMVPTGAVTYTYSNGTDSVTPTADATYSVSGTDANGCVSSTVAVSSVTVNALPIISVNSGAICAGQSFTMVPTGAATYTYSNGTDVVTPTADATYSVSGTDVNGCVSNVDAVSSVTVNALPTISVNSGAICAGQSFTMVPTGAATYTYSNGTDIVTPTADATYSVSGTDVNGCVSSIDAVSNVTVNALPTISVNSGAICTGQSFTMVPTGAVTYTYSNGIDVVTPTADATYSVSGTDANGCVSSVDAISSVTVNALPTISVNSGAICAGQSFTMVPTGAVTYTYSNGIDVVTPTADATYSVSGTDANGCISSIDAVSSVTVNALPVLVTSTTNTLLCTGETATLSVTGATSYTWSTTDNTPDIVVMPTVQTTYTVDATDANGCINSATIMQDVSLCTGIVTLSGMEASSISVYPNPNNGLFTIDLNSTSQVIVTNALGQTVITETFEAGKHKLDIHNQSTGIYFVKVILDGKQHVIKLIKE